MAEFFIVNIEERNGKFKVQVSGCDEPIECTRLLIEKYRLVAGIVLTEPQVEQLMQEADLELCDREAARLLGTRAHSVGEVRYKLRRKEFQSESISQVVRKYEKNGILDDGAYASALCRRLLNRNPAGRSYLIAYLQKKLVPRDTAEFVTNTVLGEHDEVELAVESLRKRESRLKQFDLETARQKAYNYLSRRGIGYQASRTAFERLFETD